MAKRQNIVVQAIVTKWLPATNTRNARVKATADAGSVTLSWDHALNQQDNHRLAAETLADKFGWRDDGARLIQGTLGGPGYVFTLLSPRDC